MKIIWRIHREQGATRLELGRLWFIRCAPNRPSEFPGHPDIHGHPNVWMIVWRRRLPEWDRDSYERIIKPMSREERHRYFAAKFPRIKEPDVDWRGWQRDEHGNSIAPEQQRTSE